MAGRQIQGQGGRRHRVLTTHDLAGIIADQGSGQSEPIDYTTLVNKPTIPAAQVNSDWDATSGVTKILNKPTLGTAAAKNTEDFAAPLSEYIGTGVPVSGAKSIPTQAGTFIEVMLGGVQYVIPVFMVNDSIDPNWSMVSALLHGEGSDGSTSITDATSLNTWSALSGAVISTSQKKFGTSSINLSATGARVSTPMASRFALGASDFTIEAFVFLPTTISSYRQITIARATSSGTCPFTFLITNTGVLEALSASVAGSWLVDVKATTAFPIGSWVHVAYVRQGANAYLFQQGVQVASSSTFGTTSLITTTDAVMIGGNGDGTQPLLGYVDEFRFTKGVARYTANFTPPNGPFPDG